MSELLHKIDVSFRAATKGDEDIKIVIRWWGLFSYLIAYFVFDFLILKIDYRFVDLILAWIMVIYYIWHIYVVFKCKPTKPKISKEEKKRIREEKWRNAPRSFMRKLLLQEPISKWNPITMTVAADVLMFVNFLGYVLK